MQGQLAEIPKQQSTKSIFGLCGDYSSTILAGAGSGGNIPVYQISI